VETGFSPLDEELELLPGSLTPTLVEGLTRLGTWMPFEQAAKLVGDFWRVPVSEPTARRQTEAIGAAYVAVQAGEVERQEQREGAGGTRSPAAPTGPPLQQLSVDGAFVPLLGGQWGEVKLLTLGTVGPPIWEEDEWRVHASELSYFGRMTDHETFGRLASGELHRRGTAQAGRVVAVMDGAEWQQGFVDLHRSDATRILDFPHAAEYVAKIGQAVLGAGSATLAEWLPRQLHDLKHGQEAAVLRELAQLRDRAVQAGSGAEALKDLETRLAYLEKRRAQVRYGDFRAAGYPIGSGAVESGNKLVTEARLKGAGMHWAPAHVNPLVALRTAVCADRWQECWTASSTHLREQAHQRIRARRAERQQARQAVLAVAEAATPSRGPMVPAPAATVTIIAPVPPLAAAAASEPTPIPAATAPAPRQPRRPAANHPWRRPAVRRSPVSTLGS
jgi:hypothetical protein